jgi:4-hydroxy-3-polyprenylbenzoate decarboxylase
MSDTAERGLRLVLGVTGASGAVFARTLLRTLASAERVAEVHVVVSDAARRVAADELGTGGGAAELVDSWLHGQARRAEVLVHPFRDIGASIASGSFAHDGMVVAPCSTSTLASIAHGTSSNLVHRAADVTLKERRRLLLLLRESPLSLVHLRNMTAVTEAGALVVPLSPPWYGLPATLDDLVADTLARTLDHLSLPDLVTRRWTGRAEPR